MTAVLLDYHGQLLLISKGKKNALQMFVKQFRQDDYKVIKCSLFSY